MELIGTILKIWDDKEVINSPQICVCGSNSYFKSYITGIWICTLCNRVWRDNND